MCGGDYVNVLWPINPGFKKARGSQLSFWPIGTVFLLALTLLMTQADGGGPPVEAEARSDSSISPAPPGAHPRSYRAGPALLVRVTRTSLKRRIRCARETGVTWYFAAGLRELRGGLVFLAQEQSDCSLGEVKQVRGQEQALSPRGTPALRRPWIRYQRPL